MMPGRKPLPVAVKKIQWTVQKCRSNPREPKSTGMLSVPLELLQLLGTDGAPSPLQLMGTGGDPDFGGRILVPMAVSRPPSSPCTQDTQYNPRTIFRHWRPFSPYAAPWPWSTRGRVEWRWPSSAPWWGLERVGCAAGRYIVDQRLALATPVCGQARTQQAKKRDDVLADRRDPPPTTYPPKIKDLRISPSPFCFWV
jgi:hypothetical protein